jgi:hypothetical protein
MGGKAKLPTPPPADEIASAKCRRFLKYFATATLPGINAFGALFRPLEQEGELGENSLEKEYSSEQSKLQHDDKETTEQLLPKGHKSEMVPLDELV